MPLPPLQHPATEALAVDASFFGDRFTKLYRAAAGARAAIDFCGQLARQTGLPHITQARQGDKSDMLGSNRSRW